ncbi:substrate-binding domain-containing protein [Herbivorax sp. ANBcel31]|uniref:substrate-binding domain-containing protein n=1 Tax=Herbivorax sp. ANBcel31 TaxID=3069754 RepID=UPI0027B13BF2|nr:substrate-binding domain-containing protein [Herbivorax sp. ANBcel31]MDQ2087277.1 substrate-binding domain-containing protein [Herbivorax sp. ANBcel31]
MLNIGVITRFTDGVYHGNLINGIHSFAKGKNIKLFVINTYMISRFFTDVKKVEEYYSLAFNHIDGWIILTESANNSYMNEIINTNKPVIFIGVNDRPSNCTLVKSDNIFGAAQAVEHFIMHGHKKIGFAGWMGIGDIKERFEGYKNTLIKNRLPYDEKLVYKTEYTLPKDGREAIKWWIDNGIDFTAVFAGNDGIAVGVVKELEEYGLLTPDDVAVIGYDNSPAAQRISPGITSIDQNIYGLGYTAAKNLIDEIDNISIRGRTVLLKSKIVFRRSCGCSTYADEEKVTKKEAANKKDKIIKYLEDAILKNSNLGTRLLSTDIEGIKNLFPQLADDFSWECVGFWKESKSGHEEFKIKSLYDIFKNRESVNLSCDIEDFPLLELIPEKIYKNTDDIIWIMPISSTTRNWGAIAYVSSFNEASAMVKYNIFIVIITLLSIAMDRNVAESELESALETLKQTQSQLIQSEKIAALGGLVAGVAHEINTPIGVNVTAASYLEEKNIEILRLLESGKLKRADLVKYIDTTLETVKILMINLEKASNHVKSFKQIAADQSNKEKRKFLIKDYINDVVLSLNPKIKKTKHTIHINCEDNLKIYASPGALSQIITNLILNSLVHGFEDVDKGTITINIVKRFNEIVIEYMDNGKGISENDIKNIYNPFFTTKRGKGGTGLGLNIVYNIVNKEFKGKIKCKSKLGNGATFIIIIPVEEVNKSNDK